MENWDISYPPDSPQPSPDQGLPIENRFEKKEPKVEVGFLFLRYLEQCAAYLPHSMLTAEPQHEFRMILKW